MKKIYFFILLFSTTVIYAQNAASLDSVSKKILHTGSYEFTQSIPESENVQRKIDSTPVYIKRGRKIRVEYEKNDRVYFSYWAFNKKRELELYKTYNQEDHTNDKDIKLKIFSIPKSKFEELTKPLYRQFKGIAVSGYTIPFRLRGIGADGDNFDFESSLSLQANLVLGFGSRYRQESWLDLSVGLGITGINLNKRNVVLPPDDILQGNSFEDRTANAFTISTGVLLKANQLVNLGIFLGWDFLGINDNEIDWVHDGNSWLGLGIGVSLNKVETDKSAKGGQRRSKE